jgi:serine/threonine-protein kinase HipA
MTYFIRRYDRPTRKTRLQVEDFAQLSGCSRETKYDSSMEKVARLIDTYTTFPALEKARLFLRTLFNFFIGNEDMHLKNFSLITRKGKVELAPAYDFLNTTIVLRDPEEMALPLNGMRNRLGRSDFIEYFAGGKLGLTEKTVTGTIARFSRALTEWEGLISRSFLSDDMKLKYQSLVDERCARIGIA